MTNWFAQHKQAWIDDMINIYGHINRKHLMKKFGISPAQATKDLQTYLAKNPDKIFYDPFRKAYYAKPQNNQT